MFDDDLTEVFYSADAGAKAFTVVGSSPNVTFYGYLGQEDEEMLQGYAVGTVRLLQYATAAVQLNDGDCVSDGTTTWRVFRGPRLINDGSESQIYLVEV